MFSIRYESCESRRVVGCERPLVFRDYGQWSHFLNFVNEVNQRTCFRRFMYLGYVAPNLRHKMMLLRKHRIFFFFFWDGWYPFSSTTFCPFPKNSTRINYKISSYDWGLCELDESNGRIVLPLYRIHMIQRLLFTGLMYTCCSTVILLAKWGLRPDKKGKAMKSLMERGKDFNRIKGEKKTWWLDFDVENWQHAKENLLD